MYKAILKGTGIFMAAIIFLAVVFTALGFVTGNLDLWMNEYFGVRQQNIETEIYKETEMYNEAKVQELAKAMREYQRYEANGDTVGMKAQASMINHQFADYEKERLPEGLAEFLTKIRGY